MYLLLNGEASVILDGDAVARVTVGECLGEMAVVTGSVHSATAIAQTVIEAAVLTQDELTELIRRRPDIGVLLYKNVAAGMAQKLRRSDRSLASGLSGSPT
jgi:CRP-like cAMP-binding protein